MKPLSSALSKTSPDSIDFLSDKPRNTHEFNDELDQKELSEFWLNSVKGEEGFQAKFFKMLVVLGLLIGFMLLASWALKRMMKSKVAQLNTASGIKVLETRYLSPRATLYLIEAQGKIFLIAESPSNVTHLAALSQENFDNKIDSLQS